MAESGISISNIGDNIFVFRINCELERRRVLHNGPWSFDKSLIPIREAEGNV